jgi:hypothetical protein
MRKYQPIWETIINSPNKTASLIAPIKDHPKIIQAVRKEKTKDSGWRLLQSEAGNKYELKEKTKGKLIIFYLVDISL